MKILSFPPIHRYIQVISGGHRIIDASSYGNGVVNWSHVPDHYYDYNWLKANRPDVVHLHFAWERVGYLKVLELIESCKQFRIPIIWTIHELDPIHDFQKNIKIDKIKRLMAKRCSRIITLTEGCKDAIMTRFKVSSDKIEVIPHPPMRDFAKRYDYEDLPSLRSDYGFKESDYIYTVFGAPRANRDLISAISAYDSIRHSCPRAKLLLAMPTLDFYKFPGDVFKEEVLNFVSLARSTPGVTLLTLPGISDAKLEEIFFISNVAVFPYKFGGHSGQLELAKDFGLGCVVPTVGFYKEQMGSEVYGVTFNNTDDHPWHYAERMARAMESVYETPFPNGEERSTLVKVIQSLHTAIYEESKRRTN